MELRVHLLAQHARSHTAGVGQPDFSNQDLILRDLTDKHLRTRPHPSLNSIAWLLWHMTRTEDVGINLVIAQRAEVLDEWAARLNVSLRDIATGMTDQEVSEFNQRVNIASLLAYRAAVGQQTQSILRDLQPGVLDEKIDNDLIQQIRASRAFGPNAEWVPQRWLGKPKGFTLMHTVLAHTYFHIGQCEDIRGLLGFSTL
jgi:hypothetical protein